MDLRSIQTRERKRDEARAAREKAERKREQSNALREEAMRKQKEEEEMDRLLGA